MQEEISVQGAQRYVSKPPMPTGKKGENFQSVALLAFCSLTSDDKIVPISKKKGNTIDFYAEKPITIRSLVIQPIDVLNTNAELLVSDDGKSYYSIREFIVSRTTLNMGWDLFL